MVTWMIDLHLHTRYSDGTDTVSELLINAEKKKLEIISITDHDSVSAYKELESDDVRRLFSGEIIIGSELKAYYNGIPVEVLGYGLDVNKIFFEEKDRYQIQVECIEELKRRGKKLGLYFDPNVTVSRDDTSRMYAAFTFASEILKYDRNKEILLSIGPEFDVPSFYRVHTSNKNSIFYYDESSFGITLEEAIDKIHDAGGLAFLAHPLVYPFEGDKFLEIEKILNNYKLDGLECEYTLFILEDREKLKFLCKKYNKYISGGTDYHGKTKPNIDIGSGINNNLNLSSDIVDNWVDKVNLI